MSNFDSFSHQPLFNLDSLERNHWRNRINQLKRELRQGEKSSPNQLASVGTAVHSHSTIQPSRRAPVRRRSSRTSH